MTRREWAKVAIQVLAVLAIPLAVFLFLALVIP